MSSKNEETVTNEKELNSKKLECPFTWAMDDIDSSTFTDYSPHDVEENVPLLKLMRIIMTIYIQVKEDKDNNDTLKNIEKCKKVMTLLKKQIISRESEGFYDAVHHVVEATKYHALQKLGKEDGAETIFEKIKIFDPSDYIEIGTVYACRSIGWSFYHYVGKEKAVAFIQKALCYTPNYYLWHFILGKNLRRIRRDTGLNESPSVAENNAFIKAYTESEDAVYGLYVAQMYREDYKKSDAISMYEEILESRPTIDMVYLRLALGFIQLSKPSKAKICLDEVADKCANSSMYLHYKGKYHMKIKEFKEAVNYLKKAMETDNYPASLDYVVCMRKLNPSYDATEVLLKLVTLSKSKNFSKPQLQSLYVDVALNYLSKKDFKNALKFFVESIEIDPTNNALTKHYSVFKLSKPQNVHYKLAKEVFPVLKIQHKRGLIDENTLELYNVLKIHYDKFMENQLHCTQNAFQRVRM